MGISENRRGPANTQEFVAMWSAAKEEHFADQLAPLLPVLLGNPENLDPARVREAALHLVRAFRLAGSPDGVHGALDYLAQVRTAGQPTPPSGATGP